MSEIRDEYCLKKRLAKESITPRVWSGYNLDYQEIPYFAGVFSKSLSHPNGKVDPRVMTALLHSTRGSDPKKLLAVPLGNPTGLKLINPSNMFDQETLSVFKGSYPIPLAPSMTSNLAAGEMVELYEMSLLRDEPFRQYSTSLLVQNACHDLNLLSQFQGPKVNNLVTPSTLFRGLTNGDLIGPYVSQFLYYPFKYGSMEIIQKYLAPRSFKNYLETPESFLSCWSGTLSQKEEPSLETRYISNLRDGAGYVHFDEPAQPFVNAARVLYTLKCPTFKGNPYANGIIKNQNTFVSLGIADVMDCLTRGAKIALDAAWFYKWNQFRLRPEEFGYWVCLVKNGLNDINISPDLLTNPVLEKVKVQQGNYLLSSGYVEGCPCHPSYPAGHATIAGCLSTLCKAFFDESFYLPKTYQASADGKTLEELGQKLMVRDELDKLASNIALFRDATGVHYRSDALEMQLGEAIAIEMLKQLVQRYQVPVEFQLTKRNGEQIKISN